MRWDNNRLVLNNYCTCLSWPDDALALSAGLAQLALSAQDSANLLALQTLNRQSCALKCVDLRTLSPQTIWTFWVNIFHALLVHARIVGGLSQGIFQTIDFYNRYSYVVAGHVFSLVEIEHCILRSRLSKPHLHLQRFALKVWKRSTEQLEWRPCLGAPRCPREAFECRPDWRLNLVLSGGSLSTSNAFPIFQSCSKEEFEAVMARSVECSLARAGKVGQAVVELPHMLYRYRDDAPAGEPRDTTELRWARVLFPGRQLKVSYLRRFYWAMHPELYAL